MEVEWRAHHRHFAIKGHLHPAAPLRQRRPHHQVLELEALHACSFTQSAHGAMQHQPDHRQRSDRPQHECSHAAIPRRTGDGVIRLRAELLQLQAVVAHEERQGLHVAHLVTHLDVQSQTALRTQQGCAGCHKSHPAAATESRLVGLPVLEQVGVEPEAGVDEEHSVVDTGHLNRRRHRTQQKVHRIGRVCGYAVRTGEVVERALRHHAHGAACGVCGLRHGVERAVATDGDYGRARGDCPCRSLVRHAGQLGGAAEQQLTSPSTCP